uniref:Glucan endo-1,3-beta-glucosidase 7 n=2 Tax=Anthurium amnicola TaxID=1678845 RepID=A0A1D1YKU1_9ARAE
MAGDVAKGLFSLPFILWAFAACCSGPLVDANRGSRPTPSATEAVAFLKGNRAPSTENRVSFPFPHQNAQLDSLSSTGGVNRPGEEEEMVPSSRRELSSHGSHQPSSATKASRHDIITNPVTTGPVTLPSTSPTPGIITVPSTNPVTVLPTTGPAVTVPSTTPLVYPMPAPATNPVTTPPITIPSTIPAPPGTVPITNPVTTYPFPPPSNVPFVPGTPPVPVSPAVAGQAWCVARSDAADAALQMALDYACGIGGADCSAIQQTGGCYNPNTVRDHASYAFNSYYQKNPSPTSCDFGGTATVVNTNPSKNG